MEALISHENLLDVVARRKAEFAKLPIFDFMRKEGIEDADRICWIPAFAPLAMMFGDVWENVIRQEPTNDPVQSLVNRHTYEDAPHRHWFPMDIESLQLGEQMSYADSVRFLWGKSTQKNRIGSLRMIQAATGAPPIVLLAMVEAIEATVQVCIPITCEVTNRMQADSGKRYPYWGAAHLSIDGNHSTADDLDGTLSSYPCTDQEYIQARQIIDVVFDAFTDCFSEMYDFAQQELSRKQRIFGNQPERERPQRFESEALIPA
jgi:hypothetical protein